MPPTVGARAKGRLLGAAALLWLAVLSAGCSLVLADEYLIDPKFSDLGLQKLLVMPPANESLSLDAPDVVRKLIYEKLPDGDYEPVDRDATDDKLVNEFGITDGGQAAQATWDELCKAFQVDAILYPNILQYNWTALGAYNKIVVETEFKLVECREGREVFMARDQAEKKTVDINPARMVGQTLTIAQESYWPIAEEAVFNCLDALPLAP